MSKEEVIKELEDMLMSAYGSGFYDGHCGGCTDEYCEMYYLDEDLREDLKREFEKVRELVKELK